MRVICAGGDPSSCNVQLPVYFITMWMLIVGMGPMPWTINSEIYPIWARSKGNAIATCVNWLSNLLISMTFLTLTEAITRYGNHCSIFPFSFRFSRTQCSDALCSLPGSHTLKSLPDAYRYFLLYVFMLYVMVIMFMILLSQYFNVKECSPVHFQFPLGNETKWEVRC